MAKFDDEIDELLARLDKKGKAKKMTPEEKAKWDAKWAHDTLVRNLEEALRDKCEHGQLQFDWNGHYASGRLFEDYYNPIDYQTRLFHFSWRDCTPLTDDELKTLTEAVKKGEALDKFYHTY
jgi:hypothetical protein